MQFYLIFLWHSLSHKRNYVIILEMSSCCGSEESRNVIKPVSNECRNVSRNNSATPWNERA
jgi:hypothetical protein